MKYKIGDRVYDSGYKFKVILIVDLPNNGNKILIKDESNGSELWAAEDQLTPIVRCSNDAR